MCRPARRRCLSGFLFTSRPAPGDGSPELGEGRPGRGVQGLGRRGPTLWLLHAKPHEGPALEHPRARAHLSVPSPGASPAGLEKPSCLLQASRSSCPAPAPVASPTPALAVGSGRPDPCVGYPMPSHRSRLLASGLPGVPPRVPGGRSRSPSPYRADRPSPTTAKAWVSCPRHPLALTCRRPARYEVPPIRRAFFRRRRQVQACTGEGAVPREGLGRPQVVGMAGHCPRKVKPNFLKVHLAPTGNIN